MELNAYLQVLWRRKWVVVFTAVVATAVAGVLAYQLPTVYSTSTTIRLLTSPTGSVDYIQYDLGYADRIMNTFILTVQSRTIRQEIAEHLELDKLPDITAEILTNSELVEISATARDPQTALEIIQEMLVVVEGHSDEIFKAAVKQSDVLLQDITRLESQIDELTQEITQLQFSVTADEMAILEERREQLDVQETVLNNLMQRYEEARITEARNSNTVSIVEPALLPERPAGISEFIIIGLGAILGIVGGMALAFVFENFDDRLYSSKQIEENVDIPVAGRIPSVRRIRHKLFNSSTPEEEAFNRLRTNILAIDTNPPSKPAMKNEIRELVANGNASNGTNGASSNGSKNGKNGAHHDNAEHEDSELVETKGSEAELHEDDTEEIGLEDLSRVMLVTSAKPREGKSVIVSNLALAMSNAGKRTLIIDTDMRIPTIHSIFGMPGEVGLSDVLQGKISLDSAIRKNDDNRVSVLTSGVRPYNISELLTSDAMVDLIEEAREKYDMVLMDSPALLAVSDAMILASKVDGVILVVRRTVTDLEDVETAKAQLKQVNARVTSMVINQAERGPTYKYYNHYARRARV